MKNKVLLIILFIQTGILLSACADRKPNILFILVDDLGWADVGYQNPAVTETPHVDKLSKEGMVFSSAYAATVCSPSRAEILTGRSPASLKLTSHIPGVGFEEYYSKKKKALSNPQNRFWEAEMEGHLHLDEITLAEALKAAGYKTGFFGKWHLAGAGSQKTKDGVVNMDWHPQNQGFDVNIGGCAYGQPAGKRAYFSPYANAELKDGPDREYLTDRLAEETISFVTENKDTPFFAYLSLYTIHSPHNPRPLAGKPKYKGMLISMDDAVGTVLKAIDDLGLKDNTIVIFTSDNGGSRSQKPLRGKKGQVYEGGIRVPLIYRWPDRIQSGQTDIPVASADFFPTLLEAAKVPIPNETKRLDGISYFPLLNGDGNYTPHPVYQHFPHHRKGSLFQGASTVRQGDWKLIWKQNNDEYLLFDLGKDIGEKNDLASEMPEKVASLKQQLHEWLKKTNANMPRTLAEYQ